jgi:hypothetical protein
VFLGQLPGLENRSSRNKRESASVRHALHGAELRATEDGDRSRAKAGSNRATSTANHMERMRT